MKMIALAAAGFATLAGLSPAIAQQHTVTTTRTVTHHEEHAAPVLVRHHSRQVCTVRMNHHHKVRTCRTVRY